jgi:hypothetical protein
MPHWRVHTTNDIEQLLCLPHFTPPYSLLEICSLTHTIQAAWNCLVEYYNCFTMVLIIQVMKNHAESLKRLRRQNDMQGRFNADIEYLLISFCVGRLGAFPKGPSTKECPKKHCAKFNPTFWVCSSLGGFYHHIAKVIINLNMHTSQRVRGVRILTPTC